MRCQNCDKQLPDFVEEEIEDGDLDQVVMHKKSEDEGLTVSTTNYYCNPKCFVEMFGGSDE